MARSKRFSIAITNFVRKTGLSADLVMKRLGFEVFTEWMKESPVDTGRFRGNTRISVNKPDLSSDELIALAERIQGTEEAVGSAPTKGSPPTPIEAAKANIALSTAKFGDTIHVTNNLPYAKPLNKGHSSQAPAGIIDPVYARVKANFAKVVRSVR